jgi:hypothetical protein
VRRQSPHGPVRLVYVRRIDRVISPNAGNGSL